MFIIYFIFIALLMEGVLSINSSDGNYDQYDYCSHPDCSLKNQHTMCVAANKQSPRLYASGMTTWMRYAILLLHNRHRDNIAMGLEPGQPPATNMRKMYWDYELEQMAEVWARQCQKRHDECRNTIRFNVLQNMDVRLALRKVTEAQLLTDAVGAWFSGSRALPAENVWSFRRTNCSAPGGCNAHWYSAAAWASTWRIGCSQSLCTAKKSSCVLYRKRRRSELNQHIKNDTETTHENILRRTKYMTTDKMTRIQDFTAIKKLSTKDSLLHRGVIEQRTKDATNKEPTIIAFTFCNYGPAGNIEGFPIYEAGITCTNCPLGTQCGDNTHRALCSVEGDPDFHNNP